MNLLAALTTATSLLLAGIAQGAGASRKASVLNEGTPYETAVYTIDSGQPGPSVYIVAGQHGNEPAGAEAARAIAGWNIQAGKLTIIPGANLPALTTRTRLSPNAKKSLRNLNRNFPRGIAGEGTPIARGARARAIWKLATTLKPDWVIDLHEGFDFNGENPRSVGQTIIHEDRPETNAVAAAALEVANQTVRRESRRFTSKKSKKGPVKGGLVRSASVLLGSAGMIIETTSRDQSVAFRARQHRLMVDAILRKIGSTTRSQADRFNVSQAARASSIALVETRSSSPLLRKLGIELDSGIADPEHLPPIFRITAADLSRPSVLRQFQTILITDIHQLREERSHPPVQKFIESGGTALLVSKAPVILPGIGIDLGTGTLSAPHGKGTVTRIPRVPKSLEALRDARSAQPPVAAL